MAKNSGRPKGKTGKASILSQTEIKRVFRLAATTKFPERNQTMLTVSYALGLRAKEIASILVGDVFDTEGNVRPTLHLKPCYTKRQKMRDVYLSSPKVIGQLESYWSYLVKTQKADQYDQLFVSRTRNVLSANSVAKILGDLHHQAGFEKASSHSGRRTMITNLAERGVDLKAIATLAGHASITTTAGYIEDNPLRLSQIMSSI